MFEIEQVVQPRNLEEAYKLIQDGKEFTVLGGGAFLRMGNMRIARAVDLSACGLDYIVESEGEIELGAMVTFRAIETAPALIRNFCAVLPQAVGNIIGVQFRNVVTVGATVYSRYGFSDLITALMALDVEVELLKAGRVPLPEFIDRPYPGDILTRVFIKKDGRMANYQQLRRSASDFPLLNVAVSRLGDQWKVIVGARPAKAQLARAASQALSAVAADGAAARRIGDIAAEELAFGGNAKASAEYRREMCRVMVERAVMGVPACR